VLACAFLVLGAAIGALTIYFAGYSYFTNECSSSYGSTQFGNLGEYPNGHFLKIVRRTCISGNNKKNMALFKQTIFSFFKFNLFSSSAY
jgi:hypothetical protein